MLIYSKGYFFYLSNTFACLQSHFSDPCRVSQNSYLQLLFPFHCFQSFAYYLDRNGKKKKQQIRSTIYRKRAQRIGLKRMKIITKNSALKIVSMRRSDQIDVEEYWYWYWPCIQEIGRHKSHFKQAVMIKNKIVNVQSWALPGEKYSPSPI